MVVDNLKNIWIAVDILHITCVRTGTNDVVGTGTNNALSTGTNDVVGTGTNNALSTGTNDVVVTGTNNALSTGTNDVVVKVMAEDTKMVKNNCTYILVMPYGTPGQYKEKLFCVMLSCYQVDICVACILWMEELHK